MSADCGTLQEAEYELRVFTWTLMILFLMSDCRNTQTSLTNLKRLVRLHNQTKTHLFCMYLSLMVSQVEIQFDM